MLVKNYTAHEFLARYDLLSSGRRILNAGSSNTRYGSCCINVDIQAKPNVDVVCDIHELPSSLGEFDAIVCNAVLQYCQDPDKVAREFYRVLKPGGLVFVDAPWVQPFCDDTPDRLRFSEEALRSIFSQFEILETGPSIRPGSAFFMLGVHLAQRATTNKYVNYVCAKVATAALLPFAWIRTTDESKAAGAFYLVGRKVG